MKKEVIEVPVMSAKVRALGLWSAPLFDRTVGIADKA